MRFLAALFLALFSFPALAQTQILGEYNSAQTTCRDTSRCAIQTDVNGSIKTAPALDGYWTYTSGASPILSNTTTAVTIKTAAGAGVRNYIDACQITTTAFGAAVPLAIRDGAGGTVLWAVVVPTGGFLQPASIIFPVHLRSTANTLLEVVTTTANTSGTVTLSCQGHTGG